MVVSHAFNSFSVRAEDRYFDFLHALERSETENGLFSGNREGLGKFLTADYDIRTKIPKKKRAIALVIISTFCYYSVLPHSTQTTLICQNCYTNFNNSSPCQPFNIVATAKISTPDLLYSNYCFCCYFGLSFNLKL